MEKPSASLFFDIDETLCHNGCPPSDIDMASLHKLRKNGHRIFICTARTRNTVPEKIASIFPDGYICCSGSLVIVGKEVIYDQWTPYKVLKECVYALLVENVPFAFEVENQLYIYNGFPRYRQKAVELSSFEEFIALGSDIKVYKFLLMSNRDFQLGKAYQKLVKNFSILSYGNNYQEAVLKYATKGSGIKKVMDYLNLPFCMSYAFGDNVGDKNMLEQVEIGVAMGNADAELKRIADYITEDVTQDGITKALLHFKLIEE